MKGTPTSNDLLRLTTASGIHFQVSDSRSEPLIIVSGHCEVLNVKVLQVPLDGAMISRGSPKESRENRETLFYPVLISRHPSQYIGKTLGQIQQEQSDAGIGRASSK